MKLEDFHDVETRVTDHATGGAKGAKDTMIGALDPVALLFLGRVAGMGAKKYAAFNFLKGYDFSLSYNALLRHLYLWLAGEDLDAESGLPHMAHVMWHAHTLTGFEARGIGTDDRPPKLEKKSSPDDPWGGTRCAYFFSNGSWCGYDRSLHVGTLGDVAFGHEYQIERAPSP